jgi:DNA polymerase III delta prime subunit
MDSVDSDPYRPISLENMTGASEWKYLQSTISKHSNIILVGAAGSGKSRALRCILGSSILLWLRCNKDPSLRDSRDIIKNAARKRVAEDKINWIVLEHADTLHADAQAFLRRIIETNAGASRFVLEVRDVSAITEPIFSRTVLVNSPIFSYDEISKELKHRNPTITEERSDTLAKQSNGNLRWAVLQAIGEGGGMIAPEMNEIEIHGWKDILAAMETMQCTGTSPRAWIEECPANQWDRPGGACPWALTAWTMSKNIV